MTQPAITSTTSTERNPFSFGPLAPHAGRQIQKRSFVINHLWLKSCCIVLMLLVVTLGSVQSAAAVVGGTKATLSQRNWVVGVAMADVADGYYAQFCGGVLLAPNWVITAAHCTFDEEDAPYSASDLDVLVNRLQLSSQAGERIGVARIVRHPRFDIAELNDDIALLELTHHANAPTIAIGDLSTMTARHATVFGWGVTEEGTAVDWLYQAELPLADQAACNLIYEPYGFSISRNMLCAGDIQGSVDACSGDSGGPLVVYDRGNARWALVGIVSWGAGCASSNAYGVYTRVSAYTAWIGQESGLTDLR